MKKYFNGTYLPSFDTLQDRVKNSFKISDFDFKRVSIVKRDGNSIGKAFIEFNSEEDAASCLSDIDGKRWEYNIIAAQFSKPKPKGRR